MALQDFCIEHRLLEHVVALMSAREKHLVLAVVRLLRAAIAHPDPELSRHIAQRDLLEPVVAAFCRNGDRYNLLNSAILDLFQYMLQVRRRMCVRASAERSADGTVPACGTSRATPC